MEVSGKVLREVEFRDRLRGYDTDEVDEFLEKVAVGVDALRAHLAELEERLAAAADQPPQVAPPAPPPLVLADDDAIRRTLVLAQRTADLAISEAREEAARLVEEARAEAEAVVDRAEEGARRLRSEAEEELRSRVNRLGEERERLDRDVRELARVVETERARLTDSLTSALRFVTEGLTLGEEAADRVATDGEAPPLPKGGITRPARLEPVAPPAPDPDPPSGPPVTPTAGGVPDQVEREINEDAASAAWAPKSTELGGGHVGRPRPVPPAASEGDEEALWERWAAGRDLGVVPGPADFERRSTPSRPDRDWSA